MTKFTGLFWIDSKNSFFDDSGRCRLLFVWKINDNIMSLRTTFLFFLKLKIHNTRLDLIFTLKKVAISNCCWCWYFENFGNRIPYHCDSVISLFHFREFETVAAGNFDYMAPAKCVKTFAMKFRTRIYARSLFKLCAANTVRWIIYQPSRCKLSIDFVRYEP